MDVSLKQIEDFLIAADRLFPVALSEKTRLSDYAEKLYTQADISAEIINGKIISMVAGYTANTVNNLAFVSMAATLPEYQGKGYARKVLADFIEKCEEKNTDGVHLYAAEYNISAMRLYTTLGFRKTKFDTEPRPDDLHLMLSFRKNALVTAIGSYSADIVIKKLKAAGKNVIGTDIYDKTWVADSINVNKFYQVPTTIDPELYFDKIKSVCIDNNISYVLPLTDLEVDVLTEKREWFAERNIKLCLSPEETIRICRNKKLLFDFTVSECRGANPIPTKKVADCSVMPFELPMICKPYDGRSSNGVLRLLTAEDWDAAKAREDVDKYIVQPFIKGIIVTVDVVRGKNTTVAVARKELLRTKSGAGTSVQVFPYPEIENAACELAEKLKITGCVNFEFIIGEDGTFSFLECNPRFSGGVEFSCLAGYDCIINHIKAFDDCDIDSFELQHSFHIARKFEEYITKID